MNNADVVVGWTGLSLALVVGYGAYKNKPVFGPNGIVTTAVQTGKIGSSSAGKAPGGSPATPNKSVYVPGRGWVDPAPGFVQTPPAASGPSLQSAPAAPSPPTSGGGFLSGVLNALKGLFGGTPTPIDSQGGGLYV